jgi:tetratricopeptide (TPR) repeat protein
VAGPRRRLAVLAGLFCSIVAGPAQADEGDAFRAAVADGAAGRHLEAAAALEALAARSPGDPFADDALAEAAGLHEEHLGDPVRALALYQQVVERYPDSRMARRAAARIEVLRRGLGAGAEHAAALARYRDILAGYGQRETMASIEAMEALVAEAPEFPLVAEARLWIGTAYRQKGRLDQAIVWLRRAAAGADRELAWRARKAEADALLARGDHDQAEAVYRSLRGTGEVPLEVTVDLSLAAVELARTRARRARFAWVVVALFVIAMIAVVRRDVGSWSGTARALARPPLEFWYFLPVAAILAVATHTDNELAAAAVTTIVAGALGVIWLSGAALEAARRHRGRISLGRSVAHALLASIAVLALCYLALMQDRLLDLLEHTRRFGHD